MILKNILMSVLMILTFAFTAVTEAKSKSHGKKSHVSRVDKKKKKKVIAKASKKKKREIASVKKDKKKKKKNKKHRRY